MNPPTVPSDNHPSYSEMICMAIASLNKQEGSSEMEISSYIERRYTGLPNAHRTLLTHHLNNLKNSGVISMVNDSYTFPAAYTPESVDVEAGPKFDFVPNTTVVNDESLLDLVFARLPEEAGASVQLSSEGLPEQAVASGSGFKAPGSDFVPINDQHLQLDPVFASSSASQPQKRGRGRPRKAVVVQPNSELAVSVTEEVHESSSGKKRPGPRKDKSTLSPASVGVRRSGRAKRVVYTIASEGEEPEMKRGRRGRPKKSATQDSGYGELKRTFDLFQEKVKEIVNVLKAEVTSDNQAVVKAIQDLEGLTTMEETVEPPQVMEEELPEEAAPNTEAGGGVETDGGEQGKEKEVGGEQA